MGFKAKIPLVFFLFFAVFLAISQSKSQSESYSDNPYVFEDRHFMTKLKTEHGNFRVLQKFTEKSELLRGIHNYRIVILEAEPHTFIVPNHGDADVLLFVANGRGTLNLIFQEKRESFNIKHGDIVKIPAGITAYLINRDNNEKLVLAKLLRPVSIPGEFQQFFSSGGENPESSFYRAFSTEILEAAFNTRRDKLEQLLGQRKQGIIVKASEEQIRSMSRHEEGGIWPFGGESKGAFNLFEKRPSIQNDYGRLHEIDSTEYRDLEDINVAVSFANITQGAMAGPFYYSKGTKIAVVVNGEGYLEMACPHLAEEHGGRRSQTGAGAPVYQKVASRLTRGVVFVVPPGHPIVTVASSNQNLEVICFVVNADQNQRFSLAGRRNVVARWEETAQELAFGRPARAVKEVFEKQNDELFFKGPRQQGRAFA